MAARASDRRVSEWLAGRARFVPPPVAFLPPLDDLSAEPAPYVEAPAPRWGEPAALEPEEDTEPDALTIVAPAAEEQEEEQEDEAAEEDEPDEEPEPDEDDEPEEQDEPEDTVDPWEASAEEPEAEPELADRSRSIFRRRRR